MAQKTAFLYLVAMGSNQRLAHIGTPEAVIEQAVAALKTVDIDVFMASSIWRSRPIGPSLRRYANAAVLIESALLPDQLLRRLQEVEIHFGRVRTGQRWRARTLDLDIVLWSGGLWVSDAPDLQIPHRDMAKRSFVLGPCVEIAPDWQDPLSGLTLRQLFHRFNRPKPLDRSQSRH